MIGLDPQSLDQRVAVGQADGLADLPGRKIGRHAEPCVTPARIDPTRLRILPCLAHEILERLTLLPAPPQGGGLVADLPQGEA